MNYIHKKYRGEIQPRKLTPITFGPDPAPPGLVVLLSLPIIQREVSVSKGGKGVYVNTLPLPASSPSNKSEVGLDPTRSFGETYLSRTKIFLTDKY